MGNATTRYRANFWITEDELLFLIKIADSLDEIGAIEQADAIRSITEQFTGNKA